MLARRMGLAIAILAAGLGISLWVTTSDGLWLNDRAGNGTLLGLMLVPIAVVVVARRFKYDLASPAVLFAFFWSLALGVAQLPFFRVPTWTRATWAAVTIPPALLIVGSLFGAGSTAIDRQPVPFRVEKENANRLVGIVVPLMIVGLIATFYSFKLIGGIPLFSPNIDEVRTLDVVHPFIQLVMRLVPMCVVLCLIAAALGKDRRIILTVIGLGGTVVLIGHASRLFVVTPAVVVLMFVYLTRGVTGKQLFLSTTAIVVLLMLTSVLFFERAGQHRQFEFESYLFQVVETRPGPLAALTPTQIGLASSLHTFAQLVKSGALERETGPGLYSMHGFDRYFAAKDSAEVGRRVVGALWTGTYLVDVYGDWGLLGACIWSILCGLIYGFVYRRMVGSGTMSSLLLYAYMSFWLIFFIYLNIWTYEVFWAVDMLILWTIAHAVWRPSEVAQEVHSSHASVAVAGPG